MHNNTAPPVDHQESFLSKQTSMRTNLNTESSKRSVMTTQAATTAGMRTPSTLPGAFTPTRAVSSVNAFGWQTDVPAESDDTIDGNKLEKLAKTGKLPAPLIAIYMREHAKKSVLGYLGFAPDVNWERAWARPAMPRGHALQALCRAATKTKLYRAAGTYASTGMSDSAFSLLKVGDVLCTSCQGQQQVGDSAMAFDLQVLHVPE